MAVTQDLMLPPIARAIKPDLVVALPDLTMFALFEPTNGGSSIQTILGTGTVSFLKQSHDLSQGPDMS